MAIRTKQLFADAVTELLREKPPGSHYRQKLM